MSDQDFSLYIDYLESLKATHPHASNLLHKYSSNTSSDFLAECIPKYKEYYDAIRINGSVSVDSIKNYTNSLNKYINYIESSPLNTFVHQSDFKSSIVPEFLLTLINKLISDPMRVTGQKDCVYSCVFAPYSDKSIIFKKKYLDVCLYYSGELAFNGTPFNDFFIPIVAFEVKTNIDKNMISGMEFLSEELKRTFPLSKYFAVAELADFAYSSQNYAGTDIDEIFILRKQKRSDTRRSGSVKNEIQSDVVVNIISKIQNVLSSIEGQQREIAEKIEAGKMVRF